MTSSDKRKLYEKFWEMEFIWQVLRKGIYMTSFEKGNLFDKFWEK